MQGRPKMKRKGMFAIEFLELENKRNKMKPQQWVELMNRHGQPDDQAYANDMEQVLTLADWILCPKNEGMSAEDNLQEALNRCSEAEIKSWNPDDIVGIMMYGPRMDEEE
jgi:hypothetical protein